LWRDHLQSNFGPCSVTALDPLAFNCRVNRNVRGQIAVAKVNHGGVVMTRTRRDVAQVTSEDLCLVRPLAGAFWLEQNGFEHTVEPNQICLRNLAIPHRSVVIALSCISMKIPSAPLQQRLPIVNPFYEVANAALDPMRCGLLVSFLDHYSGNLDQWSEYEFTQLSTHLYDLISLLILKPNSSHTEEETSVQIAHRERALAYIRANLSNLNLKPISVAEACGISIRYLYKIFKMTDLSIEECILDERIGRASILLNDARLRHVPVSVIGHMVGFKDPSHFIRSFRRRFGATPGNFRTDGPR
jgi:AraC-like DNA-binding protein